MKQTINRLFAFKSVRQNSSNSALGIVDYLLQGFAGLISASVLVRYLGLSQYGIFMLATAVLGGMESLSSGFGDATIRFVSKYRGKNDLLGIERMIRAALSINGVLGAVLAVVVVISAEFAVTRLFNISPKEHVLSVRMLRIAGVTLFARSVENVFSNTLRAFEKYGRSVGINILIRAASLLASITLALLGKSVLSIMIAIFCVSVLSLCLQMWAVGKLMGRLIVMPSFNAYDIKEIFGFGVFSWLQALAGVVFYNADRLVVGSVMGTSALGIYAVCVQGTQPIHGVISAALNFIFPHVSARYEAGERKTLAQFLRVTVLLNLGLVVLVTAPLLVFGRQLLSLWMGSEFEREGYTVFEWLVLANAALGASVAAHYILLAFGKARFVALVNVLGGLFSLACIVILMHSIGLLGAAIGRLLYAAAAAINFWGLVKLVKHLQTRAFDS